MSTLCGQLNHSNIIQFLGVAIREKPGACLVLPWMENGDSLAYVKTHPNVRRLPIVRIKQMVLIRLFFLTFR